MCLSLWLTSLSIMSFEFTHLVVNGSSFLCLNNIPVCVCIIVCVMFSLSIFPYTGHSGCFHILAIVSNATWKYR